MADKKQINKMIENSEELEKFMKEQMKTAPAAQKLQYWCHTSTNFQSPESIMNTSAILLNTAMQMYSIVLSKEDLTEVLVWAKDRVANTIDETIYH